MKTKLQVQTYRFKPIVSLKSKLGRNPKTIKSDETDDKLKNSATAMSNPLMTLPIITPT